MISEGLMEKLSVTGLCDDSRRVKPGNLFFSIPADGYEALPIAPLLPVLLPLWARLWLPRDSRPSGSRCPT